MIEVTEATNEVVTEETPESKSYELRELKATDMGAICKIVTAIGIREFKQCFSDDNVRAIIGEGKVNVEAVGLSIMFDIAGIIISNIPKAEVEIQAFLASLAGIKLAEIKEMSFADYGEMIMMVVMKDDFKDFFGRVIKLFK